MGDDDEEMLTNNIQDIESDETYFYNKWINAQMISFKINKI